MATVYDIARKLKLPGVVVTAEIDPTAMSSRMFNSIYRMIKAGVAEGWSSDAARVAGQLMKAEGIPYAATSTYGITTYGKFNVTDESREQIRDMFNAYITLYVSSLSPTAKQSTSNRIDAKRAELELVLDKAAHAKQFLRVDIKPIRSQLAVLMAQSRHQADIEAGNLLAERFHNGEKFPIDINI